MGAFLYRSVDPKNRSPANSGGIREETLNYLIIMKRNLVPSVVSVLVAASLLIGVSAKGQGLSAEEQQFVKKAAAGGLAEVKLSELANDRASDAKVKDFAKQMVTDHTQANNELKPIAESNKVPVPTKLQGDSEAAYKRLEKLSGAKFDTAYIKIMVSDHDKTVSAFEDASSKVKNPALKAFIDKTLPVLRQHKDHIHEIATQTGKGVS
jgi:putative membrane protein